MKLRRLTSNGIRQFESWLGNLKADPTLEPPVRLLADQSTTEPFHPAVDIEGKVFASRFDAAAYLAAKLDAPGIIAPERDVGLWAWLALFYFNQLCPKRSDDRRKVGEAARYVPATNNFQRLYRHLLLGPFTIYRAHRDDPERARGVLASGVDSPGDIVEQLASIQELITNKTVMQSVTLLYYDYLKGSLKRGSGGKAAGSPRRLATVLNQFDLTYDLPSTDSADLLAMLPPEFDRFKATAS
jgi:hypothetical protein